MAKWAVRLECGHWQRSLLAMERDALCEGAEAKCQTCGEVAAGTPHVKKGGKSEKATRWMPASTLERWKSEHPGFKRGDVVVDPVGPDMFLWWCALCDGPKPDRYRRGSAKGEADLDAKIAEHTAGRRHADRVHGPRPLTGDEFAQKAELLNANRKPPPPGRQIASR